MIFLDTALTRDHRFCKRGFWLFEWPKTKALTDNEFHKRTGRKDIISIYWKIGKDLKIVYSNFRNWMEVSMVRSYISDFML